MKLEEALQCGFKRLVCTKAGGNLLVGDKVYRGGDRFSVVNRFEYPVFFGDLPGTVVEFTIDDAYYVKRLRQLEKETEKIRNMLMEDPR